jgi:ubiquinone/menaquinone biosynthesis C-methylase UbiE/uncharacterized protein YbaR (Trm112 family)
MRRDTLRYLRCPESGRSLVVEPFIAAVDAIVDGRLIEPETGNWYRIEDEIADLVPAQFRDGERLGAFCAKHRLTAGPIPAGRAVVDGNTAKQLKFFAEYSEGYERDVVQSPFYDVLDRVTIEQWLSANVARDATVVEVGCGSGHQTLHILRQEKHVIGIDLSEEMLRIAQRKVREAKPPGHADFIAGKAEQLPLGEGMVDAAVIFGSLHHITDPGAAVREVSRVLKPGAGFYMLEPHKSPVRFIFDWAMRLWPLWQEEANEDPLIEESQFTAWLDAAGLDGSIRYSTYLAPHLFYVVKGRTGDLLLTTTDRVFGAIPGIRRLAGVIIAAGVKPA